MASRILFGTNGIRGIVNKDLTPEFVTKVAIAIGTYFRARARNQKLIVGYDSRTSSILLSRSLISGIASTGCNVYDVGYAPTPAIQYAVKHFEMDGCIIITASHNPPEYNGIKVVAEDAVEISRDEERKIEDIFHEEKFIRNKWSELGKIDVFPGIIEAYKEAIKRHIDIKAIREKQFRVVVDPANGVGSLVTPYLLSEIGCEVLTINSQLDGNFPGRLPEPKSETLGALSSITKAVKADLGVAHDGDADRCIFTDELGNICLGDITGTIIVDYILQRSQSRLAVTPISTSTLLEDVVKTHNAKLIWTKVGSTIVTKKMQEINAIIGMEDNGGIFYSPHQPVRDGAMTASLMLEILAKKKTTLSQLINKLPKYYIIKERHDCPNELKKRVHQEVLSQTEGLNRMTLDGVKVFFKDGSVLIRPSGTEAIYRIVAEAKNEGRVKKIAEWGISLVKEGLKNARAR
jgi:phosphomannomutase/phosphoglucomutase